MPAIYRRRCSEATDSLGGLAIQLCYYRGFQEFHADPLARQCIGAETAHERGQLSGGHTQIEKYSGTPSKRAAENGSMRWYSLATAWKRMSTGSVRSPESWVSTGTRFHVSRRR